MNALLGDSGVITNARKAKIETEEAQLWESIEMELVEFLGEKIAKEEVVRKANENFSKKKLEATMGLRADGYIITYGKHSRKVALLSDKVQFLRVIDAVEGSKEDWEIEEKEDGTLKLKGYNKETTGKIEIPNIIDGKFVTEIGKIFWYTDITSINIPEGIEKIDESAFFECKKLECKIIFPSSLKEIGEKAFYGCVGIEGDLNSIVKQGIKTGKNVFAKCSKMTGDINVLMNTLPDDVTEITDEQFSGFSGVTGTLTIPARITKIGANAFSKCSGLTEIKFEDESQLQTIGDYAFSQCSSVNNRLDLPNTVTTIGKYAFNECSNLDGVDLSTELTSIGQYAFYNCSKLSGDLKFPSGLNNSGEYAFYKTGELNVSLDGTGEQFTISIWSFAQSKILKLNLNGRKTSVNNLGFYMCENLEKVENSENITKVGRQGFYNCKFLTINLCGASVLYDSAFSNCTNLSDLPCITKNSNGGVSGVTSIGSHCFNGCTKLTGDVINYLKESVVTSLGDEAFKGCTKLTGTFTGSIEKITSLGTNVFQGTGVTKATSVAINDDGYLVLAENMQEIPDGKFDGTTKFVKNDNTEITEIKIPSGVTKIGKNAFSGCTSITKVEIPDTVIDIGEGAFRGCTKLAEVKLPKNDTFKKLPDYCFDGNSFLKNIDLPDNVNSIGRNCFHSSGLETIDLSNISFLDRYSFGGCSKLNSINGCSNELTKIPYACFERCAFTNFDIPDNVTSIEEYAFRGTKIATMTVGTGVTSIPANLIDSSTSLINIKFKGNITSIGEGAFKGQKNLKDIEISWDKIKTIEKEAFRNCSSLKNEIELSYDCIYDEDTSFDDCGLIIRRKTKEND